MTHKKEIKKGFKKWDVVDHLKTEKDVAMFINLALEEHGDDPAFIAQCLGAVARARGMSGVARKAGLGRESLYKALSGKGSPSFATILKVTNAMGVHLRAV